MTSQEKDTAVINLDSVINPISNAMGGCATIIFAISSPILLSFLFFIFAGILQIKQMYFGASTELTQLITDSGGKMTWLHGLVVAIPIAIYGFVFRYKSSKEAGCSTVFISLGYQATLIYLFYNSPFFFSDNLLFRLGVIFHPLIFVAPDLSVNNLLCNILYVIEIGMVLLLDYWYFHIGYSIADSLKKKKENKDKDSESTIETAT